MTLVDSSGWIAYFIGHKAAPSFEKYLFNSKDLIVPSLVLYEVYRHLLKKISEQEAIFFLTQMQDGNVVPLGTDLALQAAELSLKFNLGTADAVIYASALTHKAKLVTLDYDFRSLPGCQVIGLESL